MAGVFPPTYGTRDSSRFHYPNTTIEEVKSNTYYLLVDSTNGTVYVKKLNPINPLRIESNDPIVGVLNVGKNKVEPVAAWSGFVDQKEIEFFNQQKVIDDIRTKAEETAVASQIRLGVDRSVATTRANNLITSGKPVLDPQGGRIPTTGSSGDNPPPEEPDTSPVITGASSGIGTVRIKDEDLFFPNEKQSGDTLRYPFSIIEDSTDYLLISIAKYERPSTSLVRGYSDSSVKSKEGTKSKIGNIILPIPSNIQDGNSVSYADGTLDGITAAAVKGAYSVMTTEAKSADQFLKEGGEKAKQAIQDMADADLKGQILRSLAVQAASLIPGVGSITPDQLLARQTGGILNPNMELLFNGVTLRSFRFSFKMTPRNKDEAASIKNIIRTLKVNMAPQTLTNDSFLRTPNVFDLQYMKGNGPHPFLHRFKTCALTDMSVNYTGEGLYASYSDATPVSMVMDLTFKELEPIYDTDYKPVGGVGY
jgi:hypothetical protein